MSSGVKALSFHNWLKVSAGKRLSSLRRFLSSSSTSNQQHPNTTASLHRSSSDASQAATSHGCTIIREGQAQILMDPSNQVFYNQTQVKNRDISIALLRKFISKRKQEAELLEQNNEVKNALKSGGVKSINCTEDSTQMVLKPIRVLEALSASGLRALRYAREVEEIGQVVALDNDKVSVEACKRNIKFNGPKVCEKVESHLADARVYMLTHPKEFDVVDLDPYGSPSMFLDSAVQSVVDGGILMCSATDLAVLCGASSEVCYSKYGSYPLREEYCHEMALRILLASIESHANRYKRYIVPVLSVKMDFYIRVYVRIYTSAAAMKNTPLKLSHVYQCTGCDSFHLQPIGRTVLKDKSTRYLPGFAPTVPQECNDCGKKFNMGGPIWSAPIHDHEWVISILDELKMMKDHYPAYDQISAILTTISEELLDVPLFLNLHSLCATLKCTPPSTAMFRSAIINAGFRISGTHINPLGLKSDAPMDVIWDILRCWVKKHPVKSQSATQAGNRICTKEPLHQANFAQAATSTSNAQKKKVVRFLPNPKRHWGPKLRAGRNITSKHISLLGAEAVNEYPHHEEGEDSDNGKHMKNCERSGSMEDTKPSLL